MSRKLFWKLCSTISLVAMALVYLIGEASLFVEREMSYVEQPYKQQLYRYRDQVDQLVRQNDSATLLQFLEQIEQREQTFVSVIQVKTSEFVSLQHKYPKPINIQLGRSLEYPIHLHHDNPFIELPLSDGLNSLVIQLPNHMMPGRFWPALHTILHLIVPLLLMAVVSIYIYRHLMRPLAKLEQATRQFSQGNYSTRVSDALNGRDDELGNLAKTFDEMATRVGHLVQSQRHLIHDLSHELRTPLQRIELSIEAEKPTSYLRLKRETGLMRSLVEDTLTLAWLENEAPDIRTDTVDLVGLLDAIVDDTRFEYSDRTLVVQTPDNFELEHRNEKALNMALENIIRNAMRHTPIAGQVTVDVEQIGKQCLIQIQDQGPGVGTEHLELIFKPFYRVEKSREREQGGFGLGLALAKRQITGLGGTIRAERTPASGLRICISLPIT